ncbi:MAG: hypothetical protein E7262_05485 [Lachnospiraceae bacterium]|nr:hypothetical protein [Lachnospiraceae bacterium]
MKKLLKVGITVFSLVAIMAMAKVTVSANEKAISEAEEKQVSRVIVQDDKTEDIEETGTGETFTYRLIVDRLDYLTFRKGHDGDYTLVYSVNGGKKYTVIMGRVGFELFNNQPTIISHYYDVANVKVGDVIDYTYSYYNTYFQDEEPSVVSGSKVVDGPYIPEENN